MKEFENWKIHNITIGDSENNYKKDATEFYSLLKEEHEKHIAKQNKDKTAFREIFNINSPTTLFNGNWGSGKTFYIENFMINFEEIKNENKYFDDYIYIDSLELISDDGLMLQALHELSKNRGKDSKKIEVLIEETKKGIFKKAGTAALVSTAEITNQVIDKLIGINIKKVYRKGKSANNNDENQDPVIKAPTIVFIDNLERIGKDAKKILTLTYKLRKMENLFFVLISNVKKMSAEILNPFDDKIDMEYPIYKFINTAIFDFSQNYISILKNMNNKISDKELNTINKCLNASENGEQLSIREFEDWANYCDFGNIENEFDRLKELGAIPYVDINEILLSDYSDTIENHINNFKDHVQNLIFFKNKILNKYSTKYNNPLNFEDKNLIELNEKTKHLYNNESESVNNKNIDIETQNVIEILKLIKKSNKILSLKTKEFNSEVISKEGEISKLEKELFEINNKYEKIKLDEISKLNTAINKNEIMLNEARKNNDSEKASQFIISIDEAKKMIESIDSSNKVEPILTNKNNTEQNLRNKEAKLKSLEDGSTRTTNLINQFIPDVNIGNVQADIDKQISFLNESWESMKPFDPIIDVRKNKDIILPDLQIENTLEKIIFGISGKPIIKK